VNEQLERNKQTAIAFYDLMFNHGKPAEAVRKYVGDTYIQHNPGVADGKAFIRFFEEMAKDNPNKRVHVKRAIAEGSTSCSTATRSTPASPTGRAWTSPVRRGRQDRRALGCPAGRPGGVSPRQHDVLTLAPRRREWAAGDRSRAGDQGTRTIFP
jgi:predicted SnoaL-like aldol condensation-catalyzing enzyme